MFPRTLSGTLKLSAEGHEGGGVSELFSRERRFARKRETRMGGYNESILI